MIILSEVNRGEIYFFNNEKIINLLNKFINFISYDYDDDYYHEYKKFKDYFIEYYYDIILFYISYVDYSGESHRDDGPAIIEYYYNGKIKSKYYFLNGDKYSYEEYILEIKKLV